MTTETLTCKVCDSKWERERKRGVKPKTCPTCKEAESAIETKVASRLPGKATAITSSRESYQAKLDDGLSLYCAHPKDLGRLCRREGYSTNCTCNCHRTIE